MFGKYNGFVSKARVSASMYFLAYNINRTLVNLIMVLINKGPMFV
jgi:hypothetical protein